MIPNEYNQLIEQYGEVMAKIGKEIEAERDVDNRADLSVKAKKRLKKFYNKKEFKKQKKMEKKEENKKAREEPTEQEKREDPVDNSSEIMKNKTNENDEVAIDNGHIASEASGTTEERQVHEGGEAIAAPGVTMEEEKTIFGCSDQQVKILRKDKLNEKKDELLNKCKSVSKVIIDLDFDKEMTIGGIGSLKNQLHYCYSHYRRSAAPLYFQLVGVGPKLAFSMLKSPGLSEWPIGVTGRKLEEITMIDAANYVYLSGDSDEILTELDSTKTYIIGGIVDHNHKKGLCHQKAIDLGLKTAKLPIVESGFKLATSAIITVDQVYLMLLKWQETKDWKIAISTAVPKRKLLVSPGDASTDCDAKERQTVLTKTSVNPLI